MQTLDEMKPQQSPELLKSLHILTRDGKINQDRSALIYCGCAPVK